VSAPVAVDPAQQYLFRMYVRTIQVGYAFATFFEYAPDGTFLASRLCIHPKLTRGTQLVWQEHDYLIGPDLWDPRTARVRITLNVDSRMGKVSEAWFDDVSFVRLRRLGKAAVRRYTGSALRISKARYDSVRPLRFDPQDEAAVRRYIDDSLPKAKVAKYRRRNVLFYASFDGTNHRGDADFAEGLRDPLMASEVQFDKGVRGRAIHVTAPGGELSYRASRNVCAQRGSVVFWFKATNPQNSGPFYIRAAERVYYGGMFGASLRKEGRAIMSDAQRHKLGLHSVDNSSWRPGQWVHFAFVWDQNFGSRVYVDGELHRSNWEKKGWAWDECLHPSHIRIGSHRGPCRTDVWLDEMYIFGVALNDEEVAALYRGRPDEVGVREKPYALSAPEVARRLAVAGIGDDTPLVELTASSQPGPKRLLVRAVRVGTAKDQTVTSRRAVDGIEGSYWPDWIFGGDTLDLYLEPSGRVNYAELSGALPPFKLLLKKEDGSWNVDRPLVDSGPEPGRISRHRFSPIEPQAIRCQISRRDVLSEIRLAEVGETGAELGAAHDRVLYFSSTASPEDFGPLGRAPLDLWKRIHYRKIPHSQEWGPMSRSIVSLYPPEDRTMLVATAEPDRGETRSVRLGPLQHCQLFSQTFPHQVPVDSMTLRLRVSRLVDGDVLRIRAREPNVHFRNIMKMDFRVRNPAGSDAKVWLEMTLDVADQVILPGQRLWIDVAFAQGAELFYGGADASQLVLTCPSPSKSRREFVQDQLKLMHSRYCNDSEQHPWDYYGWTMTSRRFRFTNEEIYLVTRAILAVDPENRLARTYWNRMMHLPFDVKADFARARGEPEWARLQRELLRGAIRIVHWWIDNRQMDDGQLGGNWNDDVETAAAWPPLALIAGDRKVIRGLEKIADGVWNDPQQVDQEKGYTNACMDVQHAHEPTTCSQPHMMLLRYGDPEYIERNMRTSRNMGEWTAINPQGRRLFRSHMFNARKISEEGFHAADVPYNALAVKAATYVAWYSRNPQLLQWFKEYGESWLGASLSTEGGKPRGFVPQEIVFKTGVIGGFSGHWSKSVYPGNARAIYNQFLANYCLLGDRRYVSFLSKYDSSQRALYRSLAEGDEDGALMLSEPKTYLDGLRADVQTLLGTEPLVTWAEPATDRISIPGLRTIARAYLGTSWNRARYPVFAASYEGGEDDFAAHVLRNTPKGLRVWLYSFRPTKMPLGVRVWHLESGTYDVQFGPDLDGDREIDRPAWQRSMALARFSRIDVPLPPQQLQLLQVAQVRRGEPIETRADLAIGPRDVELDAKSGAVRVTVHNVGSKNASNVVIRLLDAAGEAVVGAKIPLLRAPLDLTPKTETVSMRVPANAPGTGHSVVIDPEDAIPEITECNNRVQF